MGLFGKKQIVELKVEGITCVNCVRHVKEALEKMPGVKNAEVSLENKSASVTLKKEGSASNGELIKAVREAGYESTVA